MNDGSFMVGWTDGTLRTTDGSVFDLPIFCVDFLHEISVPVTYGVKILPLTAAGIAGNSLSLGLNAFEKDAWYGTYMGISYQDTIDSQYLAWDQSGGTFPKDANMTAIQNHVLATYASANYGSVFYLDPLQGGQGFETGVPVQATPEPITMFLCLGGLIFLGVGMSCQRKVNSR
jgi:hypothetical protein